MPFNRTCETCGTPFIAQGNRARFCKPCAEKRYKAQLKAHYDKRKEERKKAPKEEKESTNIEFCDSSENIAACLSCTKSVCDLDSKDYCEKLIGEKRRKPKGHDYERVCPECGLHFVGKSGRATFCKSCLEKRAREQRKIAKKRYLQKKV